MLLEIYFDIHLKLYSATSIMVTFSVAVLQCSGVASPAEGVAMCDVVSPLCFTDSIHVCSSLVGLVFPST